MQLICHVVFLFTVQKNEAFIHLHMCSVAKSCLTLCDSMDCSLTDSPGQKIFQTRILEWVAFSYSKWSSWPRAWTCASCISCKASGFFTVVPPGKPPYHTSSYPMYMGLTKRFCHLTGKPEWTFWPTQYTHTWIYIYIYIHTHTTFSLSIPLSVDIYVTSMSWLL